jgi:hypothetical protein
MLFFNYYKYTVIYFDFLTNNNLFFYFNDYTSVVNTLGDMKIMELMKINLWIPII